jgi:hypothetical protein
MIDNLPNAIWVWQRPGPGYTLKAWEPLSEAPSEFPGDAYVPQSELTTAQARITELEAQLKMVLDREAETYKRHDAKVEKLEHDLRIPGYDD